jgi:hypothetical protein
MVSLVCIYSASIRGQRPTLLQRQPTPPHALVGAVALRATLALVAPAAPLVTASRLDRRFLAIELASVALRGTLAARAGLTARLRHIAAPLS